MAELNLTPQVLPSVQGNFPQYKKDLVKLVEGYKNQPLTEETVAPVKSSLRQMRTTLEKMEATSVAQYFDTPKKILKAQFAELYAIIAEGEGKVDAIIAEDTRKRNKQTTARLTTYIKSKVSQMALESDAVDYVILEKGYYNKTTKENETLDSIDRQLLAMEKNFTSYLRAEKKINKYAAQVGGAFNKARFLNMLSKYDDTNDNAAALAEEEVERLEEAAKEAPVNPPTGGSGVPAPLPIKVEVSKPFPGVSVVAIDFPVFNKKTSKGSEAVVVTFEVPKELKKSFNDLLKELKGVGIKVTK